jgi:hypothetical protein
MPVKINDFGNCQQTVKGTGTTNCDFETVGDYLGQGLLQKGVTFPITSGSVAIDETIMDGLIQDRKLHQLIDRLGFTQDTPDNEVFTDGTGLESSVRTGKTKFTTQYARGLENAKAIHSLKGQNRWDTILYFTEGIVLTVNPDGTSAKGLDIGRFDVTTIKFLSGTDKQQVSTIMQLTRPDELNDRALFIPYDKLGFDASLKDGVIDATIIVVSPPTTTGGGASKMSVKLTSASNTGNVLLGFDDILHWATGGVQTTPKPAPTAIAYNSSTGLYDLTFGSPFIAGDTYQPRLRDLSKDVAKDSLGKFYAGRSASGTVV